MTSSIVEVQGVRKRFVMHTHRSVKERIVNFATARRHRSDFWALDGIDLDISTGTTVGLVGHNGSGKSTLLKVIGGIIDPTEGTVRRRGRLAALLELGAGFHQDLTGRENVYLNAAILGLSRHEADAQFDAIVDFAGVEKFIDTQVKFYSSGMYLRLAFAVAVHVDPDLLLVDEVLAVGDEPFQRKCLDKIAQFQREGRTIVLVSHSAADIGRLCDRVVVLQHGRQVFDGQPAEGLRVLRFGYERESGEHPEADASETTGIVSIQPEAPREGTEGLLLQSRQDAELTFTYRLAEDRPGLVAGIAIETATGQPVFGLNTRMLDVALPGGVGEHTVVFSLPELPLGAGQYVVRGSLEAESGESIDRLNPASTFQVLPSRVGSGLLAVDASARVRRP